MTYMGELRAPSQERRLVLLKGLRALGVLAGFATVITASVVVAVRSWELAAVAGILGLFWGGYLYWFRNKEKALLVPISALISEVMFLLFAENLLTFERIVKFRWLVTLGMLGYGALDVSTGMSCDISGM